MTDRKWWGQAGFAAAAALVGGLLGSTYQQYLNTELARTQRFDEWRRDAYVRYLNAMQKYDLAEAKIAASSAPDTTEKRRQELRTQAAQLTDQWEYEQGTATYTLAVFGESEVVHALAEHWRRSEPRVPCKGDTWKTNLTFFKTLRAKAMRGEPNLSDSDLAELVIRCVPGVPN